MLSPDPENHLFQLAASFVEQTGRHVFLTGKAGTGKTTFLRYIRERSAKNCVVVAPTGVAAIQCGGVTIHSFFQLPFSPFIPGDGNTGLTNGTSAALRPGTGNLRLSKAKTEVIEKLDLLIIDEVSMVRCDTLDAIDSVLRYYRRNPYEPFGGVQVLFIGDLFQLPPVIPDHEWEILREHYASPFFFDAQVLKATSPLYIELKKIYRQKEQAFIAILNRVRNGETTIQDLATLNRRYQTDTAAVESGNILLTTHNYKAARINSDELDKLPGNAHPFDAIVEGDFSEREFPADKTLILKEGAQVMFLRNDAEKRYYNGKLGRVKHIHPDAVIIAFDDEDSELTLERETWKSIRYTYSRGTGRVEEEETGSFTQYPIRLAWAVTIHKSQGLTFDRMTVDAASSFAPGQVYVALSRCTSLDGIVLRSKIHSGSIRTDERVLAFASAEVGAGDLGQLLGTEQALYLQKQLLQAFNLESVQKRIDEFAASLLRRNIPEKHKATLLFSEIAEEVTRQQEVARKFERQLNELLIRVRETGDVSTLKARVSAAVPYFTSAIDAKVHSPIVDHVAYMRNKNKVRKYMKELNLNTRIIQAWLKRLQQTEQRVADIGIFAARTSPACLPPKGQHDGRQAHHQH
jgi:hypothetical protein